MQTPREEWNAVSSKKLEEAKEKFHALQVRIHWVVEIRDVSCFKIQRVDLALFVWNGFSASSLSRVSTLRGSYCRSQRPVLDHGMLSGPGFFNPFHCLNSRVKFACEMSMCMSTAQACTRSGARFWLLRRSRFTTAPCSFFELCPFRVAGVGHLGHFEVWNVALHGRCKTRRVAAMAFSARC